MVNLERVLEPNSTAMPYCICGDEMKLAKIEPHMTAHDTETREFNCDCGHIMRLAMWK